MRSEGRHVHVCDPSSSSERERGDRPRRRTLEVDVTRTQQTNCSPLVMPVYYAHVLLCM